MSVKTSALQFKFSINRCEGTGTVTSIWTQGVLRLRHTGIPLFVIREMQELVDPTKYYYRHIFNQYPSRMVDK